MTASWSQEQGASARTRACRRRRVRDTCLRAARFRPAFLLFAAEQRNSPAAAMGRFFNWRPHLPSSSSLACSPRTPLDLATIRLRSDAVTVIGFYELVASCSWKLRKERGRSPRVDVEAAILCDLVTSAVDAQRSGILSFAFFCWLLS